MTILAWQRGGLPGGVPLVLLHGWGRDARRDFSDTGWADALADHGCEALAPDLPGHGESASVGIPDGEEPAAWSAQLVEADLARLGVREAAVVGYAEGGFVAGHLAARATAYCPLVLVGCDDRDGLAGGAALVAALRGDRSGVWDAEASDAARAALAGGAHDGPTLAAWVARARWPAAPRLGSLRTPVLIAVGTDDDRRAGAPRLAGLFHDARLATVPGDHREALAAAELVELVARFVHERRPAAGPAAGEEGSHRGS